MCLSPEGRRGKFSRVGGRGTGQCIRNTLLSAGDRGKGRRGAEERSMGMARKNGEMAIGRRKWVEWMQAMGEYSLHSQLAVFFYESLRPRSTLV